MGTGERSFEWLAKPQAAWRGLADIALCLCLGRRGHRGLGPHGLGPMAALRGFAGVPPEWNRRTRGRAWIASPAASGCDAGCGCWNTPDRAGRWPSGWCGPPWSCRRDFPTASAPSSRRLCWPMSWRTWPPATRCGSSWPSCAVRRCGGIRPSGGCGCGCGRPMRRRPTRPVCWCPAARTPWPVAWSHWGAGWPPRGPTGGSRSRGAASAPASGGGSSGS